MTFQVPPPFSGYQRPWDQLRKLPVKNTTNEWIPGYACMYLDRDRDPENPADHVEQFYSMESERGRAIFLVAKPSAVAAASQDPALLIANGPTPIPPYGNGWGTQDWPAQILGPPRSAGLVHLVNGARAGPLDGAWYIGPGHAFTVISHDPTNAVWRPDGSHTLWVSPNFWDSGTLIESQRFGGLVDYGEPFDLSLFGVGQSPIALFAGDGGLSRVFCTPGEAGGSNVDVGSETLEFLKAGTYWLSVAATLSSPDAPEGSWLQMTVATRDPANAAFTDSYLGGYRLQCIDEEAPYGGATTFYTAENVAFSGPLEVEAGTQLRILNRATYQMAAGMGLLSAFRLASPLPSTTGGFQRWVEP